MLTTDALRRALDGDGTTLTLDRGFQGLPDTARCAASICGACRWASSCA